MEENEIDIQTTEIFENLNEEELEVQDINE